MEAIVRLENVVKSFDNKVVLDNISFEVERGQIFTILGQSGVGKSVTLKHIVGLMGPDSGSVYVLGHDMTRADRYTLLSVRRRMGFIFQDGALLNSLNLFDNVALPLREHYKLSSFELKRRVLRVLEGVGLVDSIYKMPAEMSGGMKKRAALARSLVTNPELILYDEPTSGLDPIMVHIVNDMIRKAQKEYNVTSILVTHDIESAYTISDVIAVFLKGKIMEIGTPDHIKNTKNPDVQNFLQGKELQ